MGGVGEDVYVGGCVQGESVGGCARTGGSRVNVGGMLVRSGVGAG